MRKRWNDEIESKLQTSQSNWSGEFGMPGEACANIVYIYMCLFIYWMRICFRKTLLIERKKSNIYQLNNDKLESEA